MSLGLQLFTLFHVALSLVGIATGLVVVLAYAVAKWLPGWNRWFFWTTAATSITGYFFPIHKLTPGHIVGALSLVTLAVAAYALYSRSLQGGWRATYAVTSVIALWFNCFVLVVQLFQKVPALKALAPTQSEAPFKATQLTVLLFFLLLGTVGAVRFPGPNPRTA